MSKLKIITSIGQQANQDTGIRGSLGHRPMLGDYGSKEVYVNNRLVYTKILGKTVNKYSGKYNSYTKADSDNDHERIINKIVNTLSDIESEVGGRLIKDKFETARTIFNNSYYNRDTDKITDIRKSKDYLGAKLVFKGNFYL